MEGVGEGGGEGEGEGAVREKVEVVVRGWVSVEHRGFGRVAGRRRVELHHVGA